MYTMYNDIAGMGVSKLRFWYPKSHPSPEKVVLAKYNLHSILDAPACVITIDDNFTWTMACYGVLVNKVASCLPRFIVTATANNQIEFL